MSRDEQKIIASRPPRRLVMGDVHGNFKSMMSALLKADFLDGYDELYGLGDYIDRMPDSYLVIDYLSGLHSFRGVKGNHDEWMIEYIKDSQRTVPTSWYYQGGKETFDSVKSRTGGYKLTGRHKEFFLKLEDYIHLEDEDIVLVHAGWMPTFSRIEDAHETEGQHGFTWNRGFWEQCVFDVAHKQVFIGHTMCSDIVYEQRNNVINLDTRAGANGRVTLYDLDSGDVFYGKENCYQIEDDWKLPKVKPKDDQI